ncbi:MAG: cation-transporting P-type ATPase [Candidatus Spechtbacterales bacterium]
MVFDFLETQFKRLAPGIQQRSAEGKPWYQYEAHDVLKELRTTPAGLLDEDVTLRQTEHGSNTLPERRGRSLLAMVAAQFVSPLVGILILAAVISYFANHLVDMYVIVAVIVINTLIGFTQEYRAEQSMSALKKVVRTYAKVYRNKKLHRVPATELVPGDIVELIAGDRVPADLRLISAQNVAVEQAALTGESAPQAKVNERIGEDRSVPDQDNMAWMGTIIVRGKALGVVTTIGLATQIGTIAEEIQTAKRPLTPFQREVRLLSRQVLLIAGLLAGFIFALGLMRGGELFEMFLFTLAALVSLIPEGLPAVISIVLAVGVYRMSKHRAIVRNLPSAETMGSVSIICTDKTGTITKGEMMVQHIVTANHEVTVSGEGFIPQGLFTENDMRLDPARVEELARILEAGTLAVDAELEEHNGAYSIIGDPTEGALIVAAQKAGLLRSSFFERTRDTISYPFDSRVRYGGNYLAFSDSTEGVVYITGAFEEVVAASTQLFTKEGVRPLQEEDIVLFNEQNRAYSKRGLRVVATAYKVGHERPASAEEAAKELIFVGLFAMIDPPRENVRIAIGRAHEAGVRVMMVTGDFADTAWEISRQVGLITDEDSVVLLGSEIEAMGEDALRQRLKTTQVVARVTPRSKLRIVQALQHEGEIVAMTGDGVNDAPALRQADIGVAMGKTGTDVAQEAAQVILTDDDFSSIVDAMEEGRVILRNIRQTTTYLITTNVGEALIVITALLLRLPLPLLPVQILFLNLVTDGFSTSALGLEKNHHDTLKARDHVRNNRILTRGVIPYLLVVGLFMTLGTIPVFLYYLPEGIEKARTMAFVVMALFQLWNVLNMRSFRQSLFRLGIFSNIFIVGAIFLSLVAQVAAMYTPIGQGLFRVVPISLGEWLFAAGLTSSLFFFVEGWKWVKRRRVSF